ncbi:MULTISPECIES: cytochrome b [Oxalobacteraceae]|jgi:cytochrome b561|uniref:Cytochrome b n=1 Tax=Herminiimonas contaminans TaxID=1111140 RepID=A0ABS0EU74_9BURK|nr:MULTISPECIES: cytochrome b [Oxalobacteraceae]MBF8178380.1 cytochrome b [Herminiimonas contaminans]MBY0242375.1 cytochrome b [Burkholderiaceae bacterium]MCU6433327.1 cytochrome b [Undibacterium sp. Jales W-56]
MTGRKTEIQRLERYGNPAIFFHWVLALLITIMIALGWYMMSVEEEPGSDWLFKLHISIGITAAALIAMRVIWRLKHAPTALPSSLPVWQARASRYTHKLLYLLLILMPTTGYLGASFSGDAVEYFGVPTPTWVAKSDSLKEQFFTIHSWIAWVLVAAVALHVLAALKHLWVDEDGVFQRMWPY